MPPKVSIVVPVYNGLRTIGACLNSLLALSEDSPSHEIIVVDNGSNDGSADLIRQYPDINLVEEPARGRCAARNAGIRQASGEILASTDADCIVTPNWLIEAIPWFDDPEVAGVGGGIKGVTPKNDIQAWMNSRKILDPEHALSHPFMPFLPTANAFFRMDDVIRVGGFDTDLPNGEDCDISWKISLATEGRLVYSPESLVYHDHRCTLRGLFKQSMESAAAGNYLAKRWGEKLPPKTWQFSMWECFDTLQSLCRYAGAVMRFSSKEVRLLAKCDFIHRLARKYGILLSAWQTGQPSRW